MEDAGRQASRPTPLDADPSVRLEEVFGLLDDLADVTVLSASLFRVVEQVTGLRIGEIQALRTIAHEPVVVRDIARRTGQTDDATAATIEGLVRRGLIHRGRRGGSPDALLLTQSGTALLEQTQGVQVRLIDALAAEMGTEGVAAFRTALSGIADVLRAIAERAGDPDAQSS